MKKKRSPLLSIIIWIIFILGAGAFLYPTISNLIAQQNSSRKTGEYTNIISHLSAETIAAEKQRAIDYNKSLDYNGVIDPFTADSTFMPKNYLDTLNIDGNGIMCIIEIPKINVNLPVYHGVSKEVLDKAVGHIWQTPLPIGEIGNHSVLTGHTGLPHAKLFTDLTKLEINDIFIINVLNETLIYKVDNISVVLPSDIDKLKPVLDKDHVTLVTCTPYGINSHRLLVRGARTTGNAEELIEAAKAKFTFWDMILEYKAIFIVIALFMLLILIFIIYKFKSKSKRYKGRPIVSIAMLIGVLIMAALGGYAVWNSNQVYNEASSVNYETYKPSAENKDFSFQKLQEINPEVFSWLTVYGTDIDYPVVQGEDNLKYVNKDAKGVHSITGSIFLDCSNSRDFSDFSNIIYGHHMEKNVMFGKIESFKAKEYFDEHKYGNLYYGGKEHGLEFFAFAHTDAYDYSVFRTKIVGQENRQEYLDTLLAKASHIHKDAAVTANDRLVLLTTCSPNSATGRDILIGRITSEVYDDNFKIIKVTGISVIDQLINLWLQASIYVKIVIVVFLLLLILLVIIVIKNRSKKPKGRPINDEYK